MILFQNGWANPSEGCSHCQPVPHSGSGAVSVLGPLAFARQLSALGYQPSAWAIGRRLLASASVLGPLAFARQVSALGYQPSAWAIGRRLLASASVLGHQLWMVDSRLSARRLRLSAIGSRLSAISLGYRSSAFGFGFGARPSAVDGRLSALGPSAIAIQLVPRRNRVARQDIESKGKSIIV